MNVGIARTKDAVPAATAHGRDGDALVMGERIRGDVVLANVLWGVLWGIGYAVFFSLIVLVIYLFRGTRAFDGYGATLGAVLLGYFAGGLVGGTVLGLLRPLNRWKWGAAFVGFVVALPVYASAGVVVSGWYTQWVVEDVLTMVLCALLVGPALGVKLWNEACQERIDKANTRKLMRRIRRSFERKRRDVHP